MVRLIQVQDLQAAVHWAESGRLEKLQRSGWSHVLLWFWVSIGVGHTLQVCAFLLDSGVLVSLWVRVRDRSRWYPALISLWVKLPTSQTADAHGWVVKRIPIILWFGTADGWPGLVLSRVGTNVPIFWGCWNILKVHLAISITFLLDVLVQHQSSMVDHQVMFGTYPHICWL